MKYYLKAVFLSISIFSASILTTIAQHSFIIDEPFWQEYHEPFPFEEKADAVVRSVAVDTNGNVYAATRDGIRYKKYNEKSWHLLSAGDAEGPAYCVMTDHAGAVWAGIWNGVYVIRNDVLQKVSGTEGPVSAMCESRNKIIAFGPAGVWQYVASKFQRIRYEVAKSVRNAAADQSGSVWIATDVGLYVLGDSQANVFYGPDTLLSAAVKDVSVNKNGDVWVAALGGVSVMTKQSKITQLTTQQGLPSVFVNTIAHTADGDAWLGTEKGIVKFKKDGSRQLLFSRRWLLSDEVNDITFDRDGTAWIATSKGISAIRKRNMTLASKERYFYDVLMRRHIRKPWIAGQCRLVVAGDTTQWLPDDDDNDGEYTGNYLAMESFRYAATKSEEAKTNARKAFDFLKQLQDVTGSNGFFARTIVPADWSGPLDDTNRTYTTYELAEEMVKEPRFKPVETRWRKSADGKWLWKGDASSDEMCGHMMGYFFYHQLVADAEEKKRIAKHVSSIADHLAANNFNMMDIDGKHTRWSVWSPDMLNNDPEWRPDKFQNSMELLTFMKLAAHVTGNFKYETIYRRLIDKEHYLANMQKVTEQNPAWFIYFDVILQAYLYPILLKCEKDPRLLSFYQQHMDDWMEKRKADRNPLINFLYCYSRGKNIGLDASIDLLRDTPLDLVSWYIDHRQREDIRIVRKPVLDEEQVSELPPASIRATIRWDANPWAAAGGNPSIEREPVFWLFPYWMGRYLKMIR